MTGFIEVASDGTRMLVNVASIRYVCKRDCHPKQSLIRYDGEGAGASQESRCLIVDHTYDDVVQLMLKTDCVAIGR